jgi:hypothetical protein
MEPTAHAIFGDLPPEQQCLIDIIGRQANAGGKWPSFDFIDRTFRQQTGGDTLATMNALPAVRPATGLGAYYCSSVKTARAGETPPSAWA